MSELSANQSKVLDCGHEVLDTEQCHYCLYIQDNLIKELSSPKDTLGQTRDFSHPDEFQFILVHQSCELSFKGYLFEAKRAITAIQEGQFEVASALIERCRSWTLIAARQLQHLVDYLTPEDFAFFREFLSPASGAESIRFRLIELITGIKPDSPYVAHRGHLYSFRQFLDRTPTEGIGRPKTRWWTEEMTQVAQQATLRSVFLTAAQNNGFSHLTSLESNEQMVVIARDLLMSEQHIRELAMSLVRLEKAILTVRKVHMNAARKHIANDNGTGHTDGVAYLHSVLETARCFPALHQAYELLEREGLLT